MSKEIRNSIFNLPEGSALGSSYWNQRIWDPVLGWMRVLLDVDGHPVKDDDGKYILVKIEL